MVAAAIAACGLASFAVGVASGNALAKRSSRSSSNCAGAAGTSSKTTAQGSDPAPRSSAAVNITDINDRGHMVRFMKKASASKSSPEYHALYLWLLQVFRQADTDFDGLISAEEFDLMVEVAAYLPRRFGLAPTSAESFQTCSGRRSYRALLFKEIDTENMGRISFDKWLEYCYVHICKNVAALDENVVSLGGKDAESFRYFILQAAQSKRTPEYKELYNYLWEAFVQADRNKDGRVDAGEFDGLVELAAKLPRDVGFAPSASELYPSLEDRIEARDDIFRRVDRSSSGSINFEDWLSFCYSHIREKAKVLDGNGAARQPPAACPFSTQSRAES
mmetsp:Transcript_74102/g.176518  ORF Transcript_74102/g.176518 Transcript_74102/m.176518 type:complete len:334 (-) Transcript_74102:2-1003(-)